MQEQLPARAAAKPGRLATALPLLSTVAATLVLIVPVMSPQLQLYYRDTARLYYPVKQYIAERLSRGELPLWDPWTESGVSLLGQISPGLFHPFTLLYLLFPFELAFKLNHVLALPLAAAGTHWLARKLGSAPWPAAAAGITYGCSGYLISTAASNLPYALGPASIPAACAGLLWLCERPSAKRLLAASTLLALCNYSGEPQSALFAAAIGGAAALGMSQALDLSGTGERLRGASRALGLTALWAAAALALSMPAVLPGGLRAHSSNRWNGLSAAERELFSLHPTRLFGLAIPRAFDDTISDDRHSRWITPYWEYLATSDRASFADSIGLGMPAVLLALFAFFADRRGRLLGLGALLFALGATGDALGINELLVHLLPGLSLFRYAEKLIAPASLLLALAAARGSERALASTRAMAAGLFALCGTTALSIFLVHRWVLQHEPQMLEFLLVHGRVHARPAAADMLDLLEPGLALASALALALALVALQRAVKQRGVVLSTALACACCLAGVMTYASDLLFTVNTALLRAEPKLVDELVRRAGASVGNWRFYSTAEPDPSHAGSFADQRFSATASEIEVLVPQMEALFHVEGAALYFSLLDEGYRDLVERALRNFGVVFDLRFVITGHQQMSARQAKEAGFESVQGFWLRENPPRPRAFLVSRVFIPPAEGALAVMADPLFDPATSAIVDEQARAKLGRLEEVGSPGQAQLRRSSPEEMEIETDSPGARLLIVSEHFDPGWRATVDGVASAVVVADVAAIGVPVAPGHHLVRLRYWPSGLTAGLSIAVLALGALLFAATRRRGAHGQVASLD